MEKLSLEDIGLGYGQSIDVCLALYEAAKAKKRLRDENPYIADLIRALIPGPTHRRRVLDIMEKRRMELGLSIPPRFDAAVQSVYNRFSADSTLGPARDEALFYSPRGKGSGYWAVNTDRALVWLKARSQRG